MSVPDLPMLVVLKYGFGLGASNHKLAALTPAKEEHEVVVTRTDMPPFVTSKASIRCCTPVTYETLQKEMTMTIFQRDFSALQALDLQMVLAAHPHTHMPRMHSEPCMLNRPGMFELSFTGPYQVR